MWSEKSVEAVRATAWLLTLNRMVVYGSLYRVTIYQTTYYRMNIYWEGLVGSRKADGPHDALLPLTSATFHILMALVDGERHGYAIMKDVEGHTEGVVRLGPGTLYGSLKRLLAGGLVVESAERPDPEMGDERRRYYRITRFGLSVARAEARRMAAIVRTARQKKLIGLEPA